MVYVPAVKPEAIAVVCEPELVDHAYVYGEVPPIGDAKALPPPFTVTLFNTVALSATAVGAVIVTEPEEVAVHPCASVIFTV